MKIGSCVSSLIAVFSIRPSAHAEIFSARIDQRIDKVCDELHHYAEQGKDEERGKHHRVVAVDDAFEAEQAKAGQRENGFDQK